MARIGAQQLVLAGRRRGEQIAAHIARRQAQAAHRRDADMGEVLAHAGADLEDAVDRRRGVGHGRVVAEIAVDAVHEIERAASERPARRESSPPHRRRRRF